MVDGMLYSFLSAISRNNFRRIFPDLVFGNRSTTITRFNVAMVPMFDRILAITSCSITDSATSLPAFVTTNAKGVCPLISS